jgi:hypothetical protein
LLHGLCNLLPGAAVYYVLDAILLENPLGLRTSVATPTKYNDFVFVFKLFDA